MNQQVNLFIVAVLAILLTNRCSSCKASNSSDNIKAYQEMTGSGVGTNELIRAKMHEETEKAHRDLEKAQKKMAEAEAELKKNRRTTPDGDDSEQGTTVPDTTLSFALSDFHGIECGGVVEAIYTQGPKYSVSIKTNSDMAEGIKPRVSADGILTIVPDYHKNKARKHRKNSSKDYTSKVVAYITAPALSKIQIDGCCRFTTGNFHANRLNIVVTGVSHCSFDTLTGNAIDIQVQGVSDIKGNFKVKTATADVQGSSKLAASVEANQFKLNNSGASHTQVDFKGGTLNIANSGVGKITLTTDCTNLTVNNSGVGYLKVSGTADKTKIEGSGASKVDTSDLNKY